MVKNFKESALFPFVIYCLLAVFVLAVPKPHVPKFFIDLPTFLIYTVAPFFAAQYVLERAPRPSHRAIAKPVLCASGFGLLLAVVTYLLGNRYPGNDCIVVCLIHGLIVFIALFALCTPTKWAFIGSVFLVLASFLYLLSGWGFAFFKPECNNISCQNTGWKLLGLSLLDLNTIVSTFMGFFVLIGLSRTRKIQITRPVKGFYYFGPEIGIKTRVLPCKLSVTDSGINIERSDGVTSISRDQILGAKSICLVGSLSVIQVDLKQGRVFICATRFLIGQFAMGNYFKNRQLLANILNLLNPSPPAASTT